MKEVCFICPDFWGNPAVYNYFGRSEYKESVMFIGVIPLIFSTIALLKRGNSPSLKLPPTLKLWRTGRRAKEELFFLGAIAVSLVLAIDNPVSRFFVSSALPVFSSFLPNRIFFWAGRSALSLFIFLLRREIIRAFFKNSQNLVALFAGLDPQRRMAHLLLQIWPL